MTIKWRRVIRATFKSFAAFLAVFFFVENCILAQAAESNFWSERRKAFQEPAAQRSSAGPIGSKNQLLASLPAMTPGMMSSYSQKAILDIGDKSELLGIKGLSRRNKLVPDWIQSAVQPYATIHEVYPSKNPQAKTVLLMQDAHLHFEAQTNIAKSIDALARALQSRSSYLCIGMEGADLEEADYSRYLRIPERETLNEVAESLLHYNIINGIEFAAIGYEGDGKAGPVTLPFKVTGVENKAEYDANVNALRDSLPTKNLAKTALSDFKRSLVDLKAKYFSPELIKFDAELSRYQEGSLGVPDYLVFLNSLSPVTTPQARQMLEAFQMERALDFQKVERERTQIFQSLLGKISEKDLKTLYSLSIFYRTGQVTYSEYYGALEKICRRHGINFAKFPAMESYLRYVLLSEGIRAEALFAELAQAEKSAETKLIQNEKQNNLAGLTRDFYLLKKLADHVMTEPEWKLFESRRQEVRKLGDRFASLGTPLPDSLRKMDSHWRVLEDFYTSALARNKTMIDKMTARLDKEGTKVGLLVVGGFHAQAVLKGLRDKGLTVLALSPKITKIDANGLSSLDLLARGSLPLDQLFAGERLFVPVVPVASGAAGAVAAGRNFDLTEALAKAHQARQARESTDGQVLAAPSANGEKVEKGSALMVVPDRKAGGSVTYKVTDKRAGHRKAVSSVVRWFAAFSAAVAIAGLANFIMTGPLNLATPWFFVSLGIAGVILIILFNPHLSIPIFTFIIFLAPSLSPDSSSQLFRFLAGHVHVAQGAERNAAEAKGVIGPSKVGIVRNEAGVWLNVNGRLWSGAPGVAYQPTEGNRHISSYERGHMAELYAALLPRINPGDLNPVDPLVAKFAVKYPDLVDLAKQRGRNDAQRISEAGFKYIRTYNLSATDEEDLKLVSQIFQWMCETYGLMFEAGMYDPSAKDVELVARVFKDNPGFLIASGWNEIDMRGATVEKIREIDELAGVFKRTDRNHPIGIVVSQTMGSEVARAIHESKNIDIVGVTVYNRDGSGTAKYLKGLQNYFVGKAVVISEIGVSSQGNPNGRAARVRDIGELNTMTNPDRPAAVPLFTWFYWSQEQWKGGDRFWELVDNDNRPTPSLVALTQVNKRWVPGPSAGEVRKPIISEAPAAQQPKELASVTKPVSLNGEYKGEDYYGRFTGIGGGEEPTQAILNGGYLRFNITTRKELNGFHVDLKGEGSQENVGFFSLYVIKKDGRWTLSDPNSRAIVTERKEEKNFYVSIDIPSSEIKAAMKASKDFRITTLHIQTGKQQFRIPLNNETNVIPSKVTWELMKVGKEEPKPEEPKAEEKPGEAVPPVSVFLNEEYTGADFYGRWKDVRGGQSQDILKHQYLRATVKPVNLGSLTGFHVDIKGEGEIGMFSLFVKKVDGKWRLFDRNDTLLKESKATVTEIAEEGQVSVTIPISEIKANSITAFHLQTGRQQNQVRLNAGNVRANVTFEAFTQSPTKRIGTTSEPAHQGDRDQIEVAKKGPVIPRRLEEEPSEPPKIKQKAPAPVPKEAEAAPAKVETIPATPEKSAAPDQPEQIPVSKVKVPVGKVEPAPARKEVKKPAAAMAYGPLAEMYELNEMYEWPTQYGRWKSISEDTYKELQQLDQIRLVIQPIDLKDFDSLTNIVIEIKGLQGQSDAAGFYLLELTKEDGEWRGAFLVEGENTKSSRDKGVEFGDDFSYSEDRASKVTIINIPRAKITELMKKLGIERITQLHCHSVAPVGGKWTKVPFRSFIAGIPQEKAPVSNSWRVVEGLGILAGLITVGLASMKIIKRRRQALMREQVGSKKRSGLSALELVFALMASVAIITFGYLVVTGAISVGNVVGMAMFAAGALGLAVQVPNFEGGSGKREKNPGQVVVKGQGIEVRRDHVVTYVGKTVRPGQEGKLSVKYFEIFDVVFDEQAQAKIRKAVEESKGRLVLLTREEIIQAHLTRKIGDQSVAIGIADNVPAVLDGFNSLTSKDWETLSSALPEGASYGDWRGHIEGIKNVRISAAGLARIKVGDQYLLMKYKKDNPDGSWRYIPIGGALGYMGDTRSILESLGASKFEGDEKGEKDLRFALPTEKLEEFESWFNRSVGREIDPMRELREELVEETGIFTPEEFDHLLFSPEKAKENLLQFQSLVSNFREGKENKSWENPELVKEIVHFYDSISKTFPGDSQEMKDADGTLAEFFKDIRQNGLSVKETEAMAIGIAETSDPTQKPDLSTIKNKIFYDVASTGGVGNILPTLVSLLVYGADEKGILANVKIAADGGPGTIDTWKALPGFDANPSGPRMVEQLDLQGMTVAAQAKGMAPVDAHFMRVRRQFGLMQVPSLVIASILGKRISISQRGVVEPYVQVVVFSGHSSKLGTAENMEDRNQETLANTALMVEVASELENDGYLKGFRAVVVNNDLPHSNLIGRAQFLKKIIQILKGDIENNDYAQLAIEIAASVLVDNNIYPDKDIAKRKIALSVNHRWPGLFFKNVAIFQGVDKEYMEKVLGNPDELFREDGLNELEVKASDVFGEDLEKNPDGIARLSTPNVSKLSQLFQALAGPKVSSGYDPSDPSSVRYYHSGIEFPSANGMDVLVGRDGLQMDTVVAKIRGPKEVLDSLQRDLRGAFGFLELVPPSEAIRGEQRARNPRNLIVKELEARRGSAILDVIAATAVIGGLGSVVFAVFQGAIDLATVLQITAIFLGILAVSLFLWFHPHWSGKALVVPERKNVHIGGKHLIGILLIGLLFFISGRPEILAILGLFMIGLLIKAAPLFKIATLYNLIRRKSANQTNVTEVTDETFLDVDKLLDLYEIAVGKYKQDNSYEGRMSIQPMIHASNLVMDHRDHLNPQQTNRYEEISSRQFAAMAARGIFLKASEPKPFGKWRSFLIAIVTLGAVLGSPVSGLAQEIGGAATAMVTKSFAIAAQVSAVNFEVVALFIFFMGVLLFAASLLKSKSHKPGPLTILGAAVMAMALLLFRVSTMEQKENKIQPKPEVQQPLNLRQQFGDAQQAPAEGVKVRPPEVKAPAFPPPVKSDEPAKIPEEARAPPLPQVPVVPAKPEKKLDESAAGAKAVVPPSKVSAFRNEAGVWLNVNGRLWSGAPGVAYQPTEGERHVNYYERGQLAELYAPLLPRLDEKTDLKSSPLLSKLAEKYPALIKLAQKRGQGHAQMLSAAGFKFIRTYNLSATDVDDLKMVSQIFQWMNEVYGIMFDAGMYDPSAEEVEMVAGVMKDNPGFLIASGWNEIDMRGATAQKIAEIDALAGVFKKADPDHPVVIVVSQTMGTEVAQAIKNAKNIDVVGVTIYNRDGTGTARYLKSLQSYFDNKVVIVSEIGVSSQGDPEGRAARVKDIGEANTMTRADQPGAAPLVTWFYWSQEKWKGGDRFWELVDDKNNPTPSLVALTQVNKRWVPGQAAGEVQKPQVPKEPVVQKPKELTAVTKPVTLVREYKGEDYYGRYTGVGEKAAQTILSNDYLRFTITTRNELNGFHVDLKGAGNAEEAGFFNLYVTKRDGRWTFSNADSKAIATEQKDGNRFTIVIDVPVSEIKAAMSAAKTSEITQVHIQTGKQQFRIPLGNETNVIPVKVTWESMKEGNEEAKPDAAQEEPKVEEAPLPVAIFLNEEYSGPDFYGRWKEVTERQSQDILKHRYLRATVKPEDLKALTGFHVDIKGGGEIGAFSLFVKKVNGKWGLYDREDNLLKDSKATVTENVKEGKVSVTIPVSEIKTKAITFLHIQTGRQQNQVQLNEGNVRANVTYEAFSVEKKAGEGEPQSRSKIGGTTSLLGSFLIRNAIKLSVFFTVFAVNFLYEVGSSLAAGIGESPFPALLPAQIISPNWSGILMWAVGLIVFGTIIFLLAKKLVHRFSRRDLGVVPDAPATEGVGKIPEASKEPEAGGTGIGVMLGEQLRPLYETLQQISRRGPQVRIDLLRTEDKFEEERGQFISDLNSSIRLAHSVNGEVGLIKRKLEQSGENPSTLESLQSVSDAVKFFLDDAHQFQDFILTHPDWRGMAFHLNRPSFDSLISCARSLKRTIDKYAGPSEETEVAKLKARAQSLTRLIEELVRYAERLRQQRDYSEHRAGGEFAQLYASEGYTEPMRHAQASARAAGVQLEGVLLDIAEAQKELAAIRAELQAGKPLKPHQNNRSGKIKTKLLIPLAIIPLLVFLMFHYDISSLAQWSFPFFILPFLGKTPPQSQDEDTKSDDPNGPKGPFQIDPHMSPLPLLGLAGMAGAAEKSGIAGKAAAPAAQAAADVVQHAGLSLMEWAVVIVSAVAVIHFLLNILFNKKAWRVGDKGGSRKFNLKIDRSVLAAIAVGVLITMAVLILTGVVRLPDVGGVILGATVVGMAVGRRSQIPSGDIRFTRGENRALVLGILVFFLALGIVMLSTLPGNESLTVVGIALWLGLAVNLYWKDTLKFLLRNNPGMYEVEFLPLFDKAAEEGLILDLSLVASCFRGFRFDPKKGLERLQQAILKAKEKNREKLIRSRMIEAGLLANGMAVNREIPVRKILIGAALIPLILGSIYIVTSQISWNWAFFGFAALALAVDQGTKWLINKKIPVTESFPYSFRPGRIQFKLTNFIHKISYWRVLLCVAVLISMAQEAGSTLVQSSSLAVSWPLLGWGIVMGAVLSHVLEMALRGGVRDWIGIIIKKSNGQQGSAILNIADLILLGFFISTMPLGQFAIIMAFLYFFNQVKNKPRDSSFERISDSNLTEYFRQRRGAADKVAMGALVLVIAFGATCFALGVTPKELINILVPALGFGSLGMALSQPISSEKQAPLLFAPVQIFSSMQIGPEVDQSKIMTQEQETKWLAAAIRGGAATPEELRVRIKQLGEELETYWSKRLTDLEKENKSDLTRWYFELLNKRIVYILENFESLSESNEIMDENLALVGNYLRDFQNDVSLRNFAYREAVINLLKNKNSPVLISIFSALQDENRSQIVPSWVQPPEMVTEKKLDNWYAYDASLQRAVKGKKDDQKSLMARFKALEHEVIELTARMAGRALPGNTEPFPPSVYSNEEIGLGEHITASVQQVNASWNVSRFSYFGKLINDIGSEFRSFLLEVRKKSATGMWVVRRDIDRYPTIKSILQALTEGWDIRNVVSTQREVGPRSSGNRMSPLPLLGLAALAGQELTNPGQGGPSLLLAGATGWCSFGYVAIAALVVLVAFLVAQIIKQSPPAELNLSPETETPEEPRPSHVPLSPTPANSIAMGILLEFFNQGVIGRYTDSKEGQKVTVIQKLSIILVDGDQMKGVIRSLKNELTRALDPKRERNLTLKEFTLETGEQLVPSIEAIEKAVNDSTDRPLIPIVVLNDMTDNSARAIRWMHEQALAGQLILITSNPEAFESLVLDKAGVGRMDLVPMIYYSGESTPESARAVKNAPLADHLKKAQASKERPRHPRRQWPGRGFTLVEILAVVGVIGLGIAYVFGWVSGPSAIQSMAGGTIVGATILSRWQLSQSEPDKGFRSKSEEEGRELEKLAVEAVTDYGVSRAPTDVVNLRGLKAELVRILIREAKKYGADKDRRFKSARATAWAGDKDKLNGLVMEYIGLSENLRRAAVLEYGVYESMIEGIFNVWKLKKIIVRYLVQEAGVFGANKDRSFSNAKAKAASGDFLPLNNLVEKYRGRSESLRSSLVREYEVPEYRMRSDKVDNLRAMIARIRAKRVAPRIPHPIGRRWPRTGMTILSLAVVTGVVSGAFWLPTIMGYVRAMVEGSAEASGGEVSLAFGFSDFSQLDWILVAGIVFVLGILLGLYLGEIRNSDKYGKRQAPPPLMEKRIRVGETTLMLPAGVSLVEEEAIAHVLSRELSDLPWLNPSINLEKLGIFFALLRTRKDVWKYILRQTPQQIHALIGQELYEWEHFLDWYDNNKDNFEIKRIADSGKKYLRWFSGLKKLLKRPWVVLGGVALGSGVIAGKYGLGWGLSGALVGLTFAGGKAIAERLWITDGNSRFKYIPAASPEYSPDQSPSNKMREAIPVTSHAGPVLRGLFPNANSKAVLTYSLGGVEFQGDRMAAFVGEANKRLSSPDTSEKNRRMLESFAQALEVPGTQWVSPAQAGAIQEALERNPKATRVVDLFSFVGSEVKVVALIYRQKKIMPAVLATENSFAKILEAASKDKEDPESVSAAREIREAQEAGKVPEFLLKDGSLEGQLSSVFDEDGATELLKGALESLLAGSSLPSDVVLISNRTLNKIAFKNLVTMIMKVFFVVKKVGVEGKVSEEPFLAIMA